MSNDNAAVSAAAAEADRVVKRQKTCAHTFSVTVDTLLAAVNDSKQQLQKDSTKAAAVVDRLKHQITQLKVSTELHDQTKHLHSAVGKLGKVCRLH